MVLLLILLIFSSIASAIPAAVLAGILVTVGISVMDYRGLKAIPILPKDVKMGKVGKENWSLVECRIHSHCKCMLSKKIELRFEGISALGIILGLKNFFL